MIVFYLSLGWVKVTGDLVGVVSGEAVLPGDFFLILLGVGAATARSYGATTKTGGVKDIKPKHKSTNETRKDYKKTE